MASPPASPGSSGASASGAADGSESVPAPASASGDAKNGKQRVRRACARCSASKRRCDGRHPSCAVCLAIGVECHYSKTSIRRGPPKGFRGTESVKAKLLRTLETTLRDLVSKLGEEQTEDEIARLAAGRGLRLASARGLGPSTSALPPLPPPLGGAHAVSPVQGPAYPSGRPGPAHHYSNMHAPHAWPDPTSERMARENADWRWPSYASGKRPAPPSDDEHEAKRRVRLAPSSDPSQMVWDESAGGSWVPVSDADPARARGENEESDILGVNERGDTMHRGSSSGLQLLSRRTLPPLPGATLPFPLGSTPAGRGGSKESNRSRGSHSTSPLVPIQGIRVPLPAPRRSGSGTCPSGYALSGSRRSASAQSNPSSPSLPNLLRSRNSDLAELVSAPSASCAVPGQHSPRRTSSAGAGSPSYPDGPSPVAGTQSEAPVPHASTPSPETPDMALKTFRSARVPSGGIQTIEAPIDFVDPANDPPIGVEECRRLFARYWRHVHSEWPVLFKPAIRHIDPAVIHEHLDPCLLYAVYAIASCIVTRRHGQPSAEEDRGLLFYRRAERYLFASRLRPSLSTVQALFLLSMYAHGTGDLSQAWVYHCLSVAMALDMGLHRWPIPRLNLLHDVNERETRVRLIWHIYILGQMLAAEMGRPVTLKRSDIDVPFLSELEEDEVELVDLDDFEPADEDAGRVVAVGHRRLHVATCINLSITLFSIIEGILTQFHSFGRKAALRKKGAEVRELVIKYDEELESWHNAVPPQFRADELLARLKQDRSAQFVPLPAFIAVEMWYQTAKLLLHRNFIPQDEGVVLSDVLNNESFVKATHSAQVICDMLETTAQYMRGDRLTTDLAYCFFTAALTFIFNSRLKGDKEIALKAKRGYILCREALIKLSETWPAASSHKQLLDGFSYLADGVWDEETHSFVVPGDEAMEKVKSEGSIETVVRASGSGGQAGGPKTTGFPDGDVRLVGRSPRIPSIHQLKEGTAFTDNGHGPALESEARSPSAQGAAYATLDEQRAQMARWYQQSGEGVPGRGPDMANSAQSYAPGLFDLEQVFFNEWRPGMQIAAAAAAAMTNQVQASNGSGSTTGPNPPVPGNKGWEHSSTTSAAGQGQLQTQGQGTYLDHVGAQLSLLSHPSYLASARPETASLGSYLRPPTSLLAPGPNPLPGLGTPGTALNSPGMAQLHMLSQLQCQGAPSGVPATATAPPPFPLPSAAGGSTPFNAPGLYDQANGTNNELLELMALLQLPPNLGL